MTREIQLNATDVVELESKLAAGRGTMTPAEVSFLEHVITRGKKGQQGVQPRDIQWTWTYNF